MKKEVSFESNNVDDVVNQIQEIVANGKTLFTLFPVYSPALDLNTEYDVVGKSENQLLIAKKLKEKNVDSIRVEETSFFVFFPYNLSEKEKEDIKKEALSVAHWYDIID